MDDTHGVALRPCYILLMSQYIRGQDFPYFVLCKFFWFYWILLFYIFSPSPSPNHEYTIKADSLHVSWKTTFSSSSLWTVRKRQAFSNPLITFVGSNWRGSTACFFSSQEIRLFPYDWWCVCSSGLACSALLSSVQGCVFLWTKGMLAADLILNHVLNPQFPLLPWWSCYLDSNTCLSSYLPLVLGHYSPFCHSVSLDW